MKILIATGIYPPDIGGPATYVKTIAHAFADRGHDVVVVTYGNARQDNSTFSIFTVSRALPKGLRHILYFLKILQRGIRSDVIFAQDPVSAGFPAALAAMILRKRFIIKIVGDYAWEQARLRYGVSDLLGDFLKKKYGWRVEFLRKVERWTASRAYRVIVPSKYLENIVKTWGIDVNVRVIPNSVETFKLPDRQTARRKLGFTNTVILSVGRLVPWKGFEFLISLVPDLRKKHDISLVILGDGPLKGLLERIKPPEFVALPGAVSSDVLREYLAASDIFALNTAYEGFSHQLVEVLSVGLPVITTDAGGNKEIIEDGINGLLVPANDRAGWLEAFDRLLNDEDLRQKFKAEGIKTVRGYSSESMVAKTLHILQ
ncbi:MAG: glycosyltransferase family 4 protein, partial [Candidatus Ryanbacteria bacterium]|nr:glycosyltransferase family 4 protein [Candidatus Ryanbacteria bacterium]